MNKPSGSTAIDAAEDRLAMLTAQAEAVRVELIGLREKLAQVQDEFNHRQIDELRKSNERLIGAADQARSTAEMAVRNLADHTQATPHDVLSAAPVPQQLRDNRDVSHPFDLRQANERLVVAAVEAQEASDRAEEARERQIKFMAMVAHELRDPLGPIRTAAELLSHTGGDDRLLVKVREIIRRQVDHMSRLVEDLLDGSRASAAKFELHPVNVDIVSLLKLAVETCHPAISARLQKLESRLPPAPLEIQGDPVRLVQVFVNLLENASKYTPEGGAITLAARTEGATVVVTVSDTGIGIPAESLSHVFDLFVQEPAARARRAGGLGIGLAVVRELVGAHGGTVVARSAGRDKGSEFEVTLPVKWSGRPVGAATPATERAIGSVPTPT